MHGAPQTIAICAPRAERRSAGGSLDLGASRRYAESSLLSRGGRSKRRRRSEIGCAAVKQHGSPSPGWTLRGRVRRHTGAPGAARALCARRECTTPRPRHRAMRRCSRAPCERVGRPRTRAGCRRCAGSISDASRCGIEERQRLGSSDSVALGAPLRAERECSRPRSKPRASSRSVIVGRSPIAATMARRSPRAGGVFLVEGR